jgi:hypothetical protein
MQAFQILETFALIFCTVIPKLFVYFPCEDFPTNKCECSLSLPPSLPSFLPSFLPPSLHEQNFQGKQNAKPPQSNDNPSGCVDYLKNH